MRRIQKIGARMRFDIEEDSDEIRCTIRAADGSPFVGDNGSLYEIRLRLGEDPADDVGLLIEFSGHEEIAHQLDGIDAWTSKIREMVREAK